MGVACSLFYLRAKKLKKIKSKYLFITKSGFISIFLLLLCFSCNSNSVENEHPSNIIGQWKLVKVETTFMNRTTYDLSQFNIVYDFEITNILTVSSDTEHPQMGLDTGTHSYSIIKPNEQESFWTMKIANIYAIHRFIEKGLIIDLSPLDGPIYCFDKIN